MGARKMTTRLPMELARPSRKVLVETSTPLHQYYLKKMGKNPAMMLVAKAELAQS